MLAHHMKLCLTVDNCHEVDCGQGYCINLSTGYRCDCQEGYTGSHCTLQECIEGVTCMNGGRC